MENSPSATVLLLLAALYPKLPATCKFGIIIQEDDQNAQDWIKSLQANYKIIKTARYDVNNVNPKKHGYKDWLVRSFFLLEKK